MTTNIWADPSLYVKSPPEAVAVLRELDLPRIDRYLDAVADRGSIDIDALRTLSANTLVAMDGQDHLRVRRIIAGYFSRN